MSNELDELAKELNADLDGAYAAGDAGEPIEEEVVDPEATIELENAAGDAGSETETTLDAEQNIDDSANGGAADEVENTSNEPPKADAVDADKPTELVNKATADGNDFVPIERLTEVRRTNKRMLRQLTAAEKAEERLKAENNALEQKIKLMSSRFGGDVPDVNNLLSDEKLAGVREDFGDDLADMMQAMVLRGGNASQNDSNAETSEANVAEYAIDEQQVKAPQYQQPQQFESWDDLVASVPVNHDIHKLDYWADFESDKFERAKQVEQQMVQSGESNSFDNIADFYAEVVGRVETANTNNSVNTQVQARAVETPAAPVFKEQQAPAGMQGASQDDGMPASIGDLGGAAVQPSGDLVMELGGLNPKELMSRFENMTPEQKSAMNAGLWDDV